MKPKKLDIAALLTSDESVALFLAESFQAQNPAEIAQALGIAARAKSMHSVARETGLSRESLYRSLSEDGNPSLKTLLEVAKSLKVKLTVEPIGAQPVEMAS
jgi:probable addiction module antidote protein